MIALEKREVERPAQEIVALNHQVEKDHDLQGTQRGKEEKQDHQGRHEDGHRHPCHCGQDLHHQGHFETNHLEQIYRQDHVGKAKQEFRAKKKDRNVQDVDYSYKSCST